MRLLIWGLFLESNQENRRHPGAEGQGIEFRKLIACVVVREVKQKTQRQPIDGQQQATVPAI